MDTVNGYWKFSQGTVCLISGHSLIWPFDGKVVLTDKTNSGFSMTYRGAQCAAELKSDGKLYWSDGDVWERQAGTAMDIFVDSVLTGERLATLSIDVGSSLQQLRASLQAVTSLHFPDLLFEDVVLRGIHTQVADFGLRDGSLVQAITFERTLKVEGEHKKVSDDGTCDLTYTFEVCVMPADYEEMGLELERMGMVIPEDDHSLWDVFGPEEEVRDFDATDILNIVDNKYTMEGRLCGTSDVSNAECMECISSLVERADAVYGFSYGGAVGGLEERLSKDGHVFLVAGHRLQLEMTIHLLSHNAAAAGYTCVLRNGPRKRYSVTYT